MNQHQTLAQSFVIAAIKLDVLITGPHFANPMDGVATMVSSYRDISKSHAHEEGKVVSIWQFPDLSLIEITIDEDTTEGDPNYKSIRLLGKQEANDPSADFYAMIHLMNNPSPELQKELENKLFLVRQIALACDGKTKYEGSPKCDVTERWQAAAHLSAFVAALTSNLAREQKEALPM